MTLRRSAMALLLVASVLAASAAEPAPAAPAFRVKLLDSKTTFDSRSEIGKHVLVVRFQASWCKVCRREADALGELATRYHSQGVTLVALHVEDATTDVRRFVRAHHIGYPVALDPRLTIGNRFGVKATPVTIVIDRKGEIAARIEGASAVKRLPAILDRLAARTDGR